MPLLIPPSLGRGARINPAKPPRLGEMVEGWAYRDGDKVVVLYLQSVAEHHGFVGRFLDQLHPCVKFVNVVNPVLVGMLRRRGWKQTWVEHPAGPYDEWHHPGAELQNYKPNNL